MRKATERLAHPPPDTVTCEWGIAPENCRNSKLRLRTHDEVFEQPPGACGSVYCASKFGVKAMAHSLRLELNGEQIRVTSVDPGMAETEFSDVRLKDGDKAKAVYQGVKPLSANDVAECVRWCLMLPDHVNIDEMLVKCLEPGQRAQAAPAGLISPDSSATPWAARRAWPARPGPSPAGSRGGR